MAFSTTGYFTYRRWSRDRQGIDDAMIEQVLENPCSEFVQSDGRIRKWGWIEEKQRYLRVIVLADGMTVHNAFFDRSFKGTSR